MKVSELQDKTAVEEIILKITDKEEPRAVRGGSLQVCNLTGEDDSGKVTITLWNDDIHMVKPGDTIKITKGWASIYNDVMQVSSGRFGTLEVVQKGAESAADSAEVAEIVEEAAAEEEPVETEEKPVETEEKTEKA